MQKLTCSDIIIIEKHWNTVSVKGNIHEPRELQEQKNYNDFVWSYKIRMEPSNMFETLEMIF